MDNQSPKVKIQMYLDARRPIIYIRNFDFQAVDRLIEEVCQKDYVVEEYSEAGGRIDFKTKSPKGKDKMSLDEYLSIYNSSQFEKDKHRFSWVGSSSERLTRCAIV